MTTDSIEDKLDKEKRPAPDENIDVQLNRIEAEAEQTKLEAPHPQFITPQARPSKPSFKQRLRARLKSKKFWFVAILLLLAIKVGLWFVDPVRWWALNLVGQRSTLTIQTATPSEAKQPAAKLKNVSVVVNGQSYKTDQNGEVKLADQPYGRTAIAATKQGYADVQTELVLDFDPFFYKFGGKEADEAARKVNLELKAVGMAVWFKAVDYLSGLPLAQGEYTVGDVVVKPDQQGMVAFKAPAQDGSKVTVVSKFGGAYIDRTFDIVVNEKEPPTLVFIPAGKHYFMSRRDGALSIYSSNLDGGETKLVIPGTGKESPTDALAVSPSGKYGVLASTRDGGRSEKGALLHRIYVIDLEKKLMTKVDEAPSFAFADWSGDTLVYQTVDRDGPQTSKLRAVDVTSNKLTDIASGLGFGRQVVGFDQVAFAQFDETGEGVKATFKRFDLKSKSLKDLVQVVSGSNIIQPDFDRVAVTTLADQKWQEYNLNTGQLKAAARPTETTSHLFLSSASPDGSQHVLLDRIDGKFRLMVKNIAAVKQLYANGGLSGPVRWVGSALVFRVTSERETADYAISVKGGQPKKISDITASTSSLYGTETDPNLFKYY